jgi:hypothetical protein
MAGKINPSLKIKKRIFLVGCPRSGTTLLQSMFAAHPEVCSFPETHFFSKTIKAKGYKSHLAWYGHRKRRRIRGFLKRIDAERLISILPFFTFSKHKWARGLLGALDEMAASKGGAIWMEKTPMHLYHIDVVASLYDATNQHSDEWKEAKSIDRCIKRWKKDTRISQGYIGAKNHFYVRFEDLKASPELTLKKLCDSIGLDYKVEMLEYQKAAQELIFKEEQWKMGNTISTAGDKFQKIFSQKEQLYIKEGIADINLAVFD